MQTLKTISQEDLDTSPLEWFKEQYVLIQQEVRRKQRANALYATSYYRANRDNILTKRKELQSKKTSETKGEPRRRGRPRKHTFSDDDASQGDIPTDE